ncbi:MAG: hypothetical protein EXR51_05635 [Dehalococcoidia bacterium]|nr:hypothetical protein [Dehalococcoidia bacterium]
MINVFPAVGRLLAAGVCSWLLLWPAVALAHERRDVGKYQFVVGWAGEPAFEGEKNGISLRILVRDSNEPVSGAEQTLKAEVLFGTQRKEVPLRAVFQQPGMYAGDLVPTKEGDYRFRFFGAIDGAEVNQTFDSADKMFNGVESIRAIQFPAAESPVATAPPVPAAAANSGAALAGLQSAAQAAQSAAASAQTLAIVGAVLGGLGLLLGGVAMLRNRPAAA